jgi:Holliday junction resolvase RusA-like endonuclease
MAAVRVVLYLPIPKSRRRAVTVGDPHRVRPDSDNYAKGVIDALYPHRGPEDDGQLAHEEATKVYTDGEVGASVTLLTWPEYTRIHNVVEAELAEMRTESL